MMIFITIHIILFSLTDPNHLNTPDVFSSIFPWDINENVEKRPISQC